MSTPAVAAPPAVLSRPAGSPATVLRLALVADLLEERWPSMDLVASMVASHVVRERPHAQVSLLRAPFTRRIGWLLPRGDGQETTRDRVLNRFWDYPRWLRARAGSHDVYHVLDHSYAQLVHVLPPGRTVVTCHDIDAFRQLLPGHRREGGGLPDWLVRRLASGLRAAARVVCVSASTRDDLLQHGLVTPDRVVVVPNGVDSRFADRADRATVARADRLLGEAASGTCLLHVGSTVARKRIDRLIDIVAAVRRSRPDVWLIRAGGALTASQRDRAAAAGVDARLVELPFLDDRVLAEVYQRCAVVLLPSDREGFGLPLVEALAAGTPVVASRIPVLQEVGGEAAEYVAPGDTGAWTAAVLRLLQERERDPAGWQRKRERGRARATRFTWSGTARRLLDVYDDVAGGAGAPGGLR